MVSVRAHALRLRVRPGCPAGRTSRTFADTRGAARDLRRTWTSVRLRKRRRLVECSANGDLTFHQIAPAAEDGFGQFLRTNGVSVWIDWRVSITGTGRILLAPLDDHRRRNFKMKLQAVDAVPEAKRLVPAVLLRRPQLRPR